MIDSPPPFAPVKEWTSFLRMLEALPAKDNLIRHLIKEAKWTIAFRKANPLPGDPA
jgi:hypothetical protein